MRIDGAAFDVCVECEEGAPVLVLVHLLSTKPHLVGRLMPAFPQRFRIVPHRACGQSADCVSPNF